jgi:membrane carboxypeptidase/penicillin-binding protein PbpC
VSAPFFIVRPAIAGTFRWAGPTILVFTAADRPPAPAASSDARLLVLNPPPGAVYLIDPTLRQAFQTLPLRASAASRGPIEWRVDGERVGSCDADATIDWPLVPGAHTVTARDAHGHQSDALILVK